jgi:hypothetical protein
MSSVLNILMIVVMLWAAGVLAVAVGMALVAALDILENNHDI